MLHYNLSTIVQHLGDKITEARSKIPLTTRCYKNRMNPGIDNSIRTDETMAENTENQNLFGASQKLLQCRVISKTAAASDRFIELENFRLWAYMMFHKHGLKVQVSSLWLWLEEKLYKEKKVLYTMASQVVAVSRIGVFLFDEQHGYNHVSYRYVQSDQVGDIKDILMSHVSPQLVDDGNCELVVEKGYCIKSDCKNPEKLVLGLSDKDDRFWYREK